jgi:outer membrane protein assembly factor BamB
MGRLYCMDAATGRPLWESDLGPTKRLVERNLIQSNPGFEYTATGGHSEQFVSCPMVAGGVVVCNNHNALTSGIAMPGISGFDRRTGRPLWEQPGLAWLYTTAARWQHDSGEYALVTACGQTHCLEPATGRILWKSGSGGGGRRSTYIAPISGDLMVRDNVCYRIGPQGVEPRTNLVSGVGKWPAISKNRVFSTEVGEAALSCIGLESGESLGKAGKREANNYWCVPVVGDERVFVADYNGTGITYYDINNGDLRKLPGTIPAAGWIAPAYVAGRLYVKGAKDVRCYDVRAKAAKPLAPAPIAAGADSPFLDGREQAVAALVKAHADGDKTTPDTLRAWLGSDDWPRMEAAACAMASNSALAAAVLEDAQSAYLRLTGKGRGTEVVELLDIAPGIRQSLAQGLAPKMTPLLGSAQSDVVSSACRLVAALGAPGRVHTPRLLEIFKHGDADTSWAAARALDVLGVPEELAADTLAAIVPVLGEGAYERQWGGLQVLQRLGGKAAPALDRVKAVAAQKDGCLAILAWDVLIAIGEPAVPAMAELLIPVHDRDYRLLLRLHALRQRDVSAVIAEIERLTGDHQEKSKKVAPLLGTIRRIEARVRAADIEAMLKADPSKLVLADLLVVLRDPHAELREAAGQAIGKIGPSALPELIKALDANDPAVARDVARAIGRVNAPVDATAIPGLLKALKTEVEEIRNACAQRAAAHPDRATEMRAGRLRQGIGSSLVIPALALTGTAGVKAAADWAEGNDEVARTYAEAVKRALEERTSAMAR